MKQIESAIAMNRKGVAHFAQQEFEQAIQAFQAAIDRQPDYTDAYYNLGLALTKVKRWQEAMNAYEALIALAPQHLGGCFQLGCLWMQRGNDRKAIEHFIAIEQTYPQHVETLLNLAACYLRLGYVNEAKSYYLKALEVAPDEALAYFNLGVISVQQGRVKEAVDIYLRALKINPDYYDAHHNLAVAYLALNNTEDALLHFRAALQLQPHNNAVRHSVDILSREKKLSSSPPEYIRSLFDAYADHYDDHLTQTLRYEVPHRLLAMMKKHIEKEKVDILDLGCGTGLMGEVFKPHAQWLVGVDLSKNMLAVAAQKHIYDELIEADLLSYLKTSKATFDWVLAGDVFVYFGDLAALFSAAIKVMRAGGLLAFNAEISEQESYHMTYSGRFSHHENYIASLVRDLPLKLLHHQTATMRTQNEVAVSGHFYLLQKLC